MTALENFVSPALTRALGWTLLHSLWQGALVAAVLAGALLLLRRQRAEVRYVASAGALGMVVALAGITFGLYFNSGAEPGAALLPTAAKVSPLTLRPAEAPLAPAATEALDAAPREARGSEKAVGAVRVLPAAEPQKAASLNWLATGLRYFDQHLPLLVVGWLLGLLAMSLRLLGGLLYVQRLKRYRTRAVSAAWQERLAALSARGGLRRPVALLESALVQVPLVVGHVRPVILLPLGAVAGLSVAHLEAILAHELAHVLRRDYLVNLLQTVAEALFFYHPAVWFMARCVRTERENCCDDVATALCDGDALRLARALTALAEWSQSAVVPTAPRLALAAMGHRGALLNRVRRLVQRRPAAPTLAEGFMAGALVLGGLGLLGGSAVLAGPLARPTTPAKPEATDWQTGPATPNAADTAKHAAGAVITTTTSATTAQLTEELGEKGIAADADAPGQDRPRPRRRAGRDGQLLTLISFAEKPNSVVITKDKKGRLTGLVVNGQRVETETGGGKLKSKAQQGRGEAGPVVQLGQVPAGAVAWGYGYQSLEEAQRRLERGGRGLAYQYQLSDAQLRALTLSGQNMQRLKVMPDGSLNQLRLPSGAVPGFGGSSPREALRSAERALQEASSAKDLTATQRQRIGESLEKVRAQLTQPENATDFRQLHPSDDPQDEVPERSREWQQQVQGLGLARVENDQERADRARAHAERDRRHAERDRQRADRRRAQDEALVDQLLKDGLIQDRENFQFKLTASSLTVNGKVQPQPVFQKYRKLYESTGRKLTGNHSILMTRNSDSRTITGYSDSDSNMPPPPPPRAPRAPRAPGAMPAPPAPPALAAPAPPAPPRLDSDAVRSELRKDGLIGADDKSFQLQLNSSGLMVNGKAQPAETAAKYRKLLGHEKGNYNMTFSVD